MLNSDDLRYLDSITPNLPPSPPAPEHQGLMSRAGALLANLPNNASASMGETIQGAYDWLTDKPPILREEEKAQRQRGLQERGIFWPQSHVAAPEGTGSAIMNVVGEGILPELPSLLIPGGAISKGAKAIGAGERIAGLAGSVGAGVLAGNRESPQEAGIQGAEFGLMDAAGAFLPKGTRPLLRAVVQGGTGAGVTLADQAMRGNDPLSQQSLTQAGVMAAFPFATQGRALFRRGEARPTPAPEISEPGTPEGWVLRSRSETPDGRFEHVFDTPEGPQTIIHEQPIGGAVPEPSFQTVGEPYGVNPRPPTRKLLRQYNAGEAGDVIEGQFEPQPPRQLTTPRNEDRITAIPGTPQLTGRPFEPGESGFTVGEGSEPFTPTPDVIQAPGRPLLRNREISVEPTGEAPAITTTEGPQAPATGLRPLSGEEGAVSRPLLQSLGGGTIGAGVGYALPGTEDEKRQRALMMGVIGAGAPLVRKLFKSRFGEQYLKTGQSPALDTAKEQARGAVGELESRVLADLKPALPHLPNLTAPQRDALKIFMGSDRAAGATTMLRSAHLPPEVENFALKTTATKAELQKIVADAQADPEKAKLINSTLGTYVTNPFRAFVNPKEHARSGVMDAMKEQVVQDNMKLPQYAGMSEELVRKDVEAWYDEVKNFGDDWSKYATEGKSRMSQSLFTPRKNLRPIVEKVLGKIEDPIEREVLTVAKLAKSANSAKLVGELMQPHAVDESGRPLTMSRADWDARVQAAKAKGDTAEVQALEGQYKAVPDNLPGLGKLSKTPGGMMAQRQVMDALQIGPAHQTWDMESGILGMLAARFTSITKAAHTLYNPATHLHNVVQAPLQAIAAGLNPLTFPGQVRRLFNDRTRLQWAKQDGILDAHLGAGEFRRAADSFEKLLAPKTWTNLPARVARGVHESVKSVYGKPDQWVRGAAYNKFLDEGLNKGMGTAEARRYAVENTNRYTQNYSNVAPGVGVLRNVPLVNPFISYSAEMLRVIKNLAQDVVTNANGRRWSSGAALASYLGLGSGIAALVNSSRSDEDKKKLAALIPLLPPYMRGRTQMMVGDPKGQNTNLFNANPWLPAEDFIQTAKNILSGDWDAVKQTNPVAGMERSPLLNIWSETQSGKDTATGQPTNFLKSVRQNALPSWIPGNYTANKLAQGFTSNESGELGVTDSSGRRETPLSALGSLLGVSVAQMNPRKLLQRRQHEQQDAISAAKSDARRILSTDVNEEQKQAARDEFATTKRRLLQR